MNARARFLLFAAAAVLWVAGQVVAGCATGGETAFGDDDDDGVAGTSAVGGQGGDAGGGGDGASGGQGPCAIDCSDIQTDQCTVGQCNTESGLCEIVYVQDGTECDDGEFCTLADECLEGACMGGVQNDCGDVPSACETVVCNEQSQSCSTQALADGTVCAASEPCIVNAQCQNGLCIGNQKDCTFGPVPNECYVSQCNPNSGDCEPEPDPAEDGASCHDENDKCLVNGTCNAGACENPQPLGCTHLTVPQGCLVGSCNSVTGLCEQNQAADSDPCDDLDGCSDGETCQQGVCTGGTTIGSCADDDGCCPAGCDELSDNDCVLQILLMGEDVDQLGWNSFRDALSASGAVWTERDLDNQPFPSAGELGLHDTLIWFAEYSSSVLDADVQIVANWLQSGGRSLFIAGMDLMYDFGTAVGGTGEHNLYSLWGASYVGDYAGATVVTIDGVVGDPIGWDFAPPNGLELSMNADSNGDYANELAGLATTGMLYGAGGTGSGRSALSHYDAGTYRAVWLGVNFHNGLVNPLQRAQLMHNTLTFFSE